MLWPIVRIKCIMGICRRETTCLGRVAVKLACSRLFVWEKRTSESVVAVCGLDRV